MPVRTNRNTVYSVDHAATYLKEDQPPRGRDTWEHNATTTVLASDAEDAITRVKAHIDRDDRADGTRRRRVSLLIVNVKEGVTIDVV